MSAAENAVFSGRRGQQWTRSWSVGGTGVVDMTTVKAQIRRGESESATLEASSYGAVEGVAAIDLSDSVLTGSKVLALRITSADSLLIAAGDVWLHVTATIDGEPDQDLIPPRRMSWGARVVVP